MKQVFAATAAFALLRLGSLAQANITIDTVPMGSLGGGSFQIIYNGLPASNRIADYSPSPRASVVPGSRISQLIVPEPSLLSVLLSGIGGLMWRRWR